jgi:hypothetical protein
MKESTRWLATSQGGTFLNKDSGSCYEVNRVGGIITLGITEGKSLEEIVSQLQEVFGVGKERLQIDVECFFAKLLTKGLVEPQA